MGRKYDVGIMMKMIMMNFHENDNNCQVGPAATVNYEAAGASDDWAKVIVI